MPAWLVFSAMLIRAAPAPAIPGLTPESTSLEEEGVAAAARQAIAESFARHLMLAFDIWQDQGFAAAAQSYSRRLRRRNCAIDPSGDLILRVGDGPAAAAARLRRPWPCRPGSIRKPAR